MKKILPLGLAAVVLTAASGAEAHHPLAGQAMTTLEHGVLSGIGHPLLGFDHLFFVLLMGVAAAYAGGRFTLPIAYLAAMCAGVTLSIAAVALPMVEPAIALSLLVLGVLAMRGKALSPVMTGIVFAAAGLFHGAAFGESIAGQEGGAGAVVIAGYFLGLVAVQWLLAVGAGYAMTGLLRAADAASMPARLGGAIVAGMGIFLTLEALEGAAFAALGLGA
ncbi:MAG: HupE/UreJ family protein [Pseudomonadota bacterium]